jgi:hypothetical protein
MAGLLVLAATLVIRLLTHEDRLLTAATFLRYEDHGSIAILQITNLGQSKIVWACDASVLRRGRTNWFGGIVGDHVNPLEAHRGLEVRVPMKLLANSDVRPSSIKVRFERWQPQRWQSSFRYRVRFLLARWGIDTRPLNLDAILELPPADDIGAVSPTPPKPHE